MKSALAAILVLLVPPVPMRRNGRNSTAASTRWSPIFRWGPRRNRIDYLSLDAGAKRLYVSLMGAGKLLVFDTAQNKPLKELDGFPKTTGVLAVPSLNRVFSSVPGGGLGPSLAQGLGMLGLSAGHGTVAVIDTDSLRVIARLPGGVFPDGIAYDRQGQSRLRLRRDGLGHHRHRSGGEPGDRAHRGGRRSGKCAI